MQVQDAAAAQAAAQQPKNLYVTVSTYDTNNKQVGFRVVDMYHYGTRNWHASHLWWAMHNGHTVDIAPADDDAIALYLKESKAALAAKFNGDTAVAAA